MPPTPQPSSPGHPLRADGARTGGMRAARPPDGYPGAMDVVDLHEAFRRLDAPWTPRIVGAVNGFHAKVARLEGEFVWHSHAEEDELFLVLEGRLRLCLRDRDVVLEPGQLHVVPRGVEHLPIAEPFAHVLLFEPASTRNTGGVTEARTVEDPEWI